MTYVVDENCIKCKLMDCVEVCPVDCFYEGKNMLVIHPDECIDCGVCEPECPVEAIHSDTEENMEKWAEINRVYSEKWPVITEKKDPPLDSEKWKNVENKYDKYFNENFKETIHPSQIDLKQEIKKIGNFSLLVNLLPFILQSAL